MDLIRMLREKQGKMSQADFAECLGISETTLSRIYSGQRVIGEATGRRIIKVYPDLEYWVIRFLVTKQDGDAAQ